MIIISGPSCVGKSLTVNRLVKYYGYETLTPLTSRKKRPYEIDGIHYAFVGYSRLKVMMQQKDKGFWDIPVNRDIYGYLRKDIEKAIEKERIVIQATSNIAIQIKMCYSEVKLVFFDFETESEQVKRMKDRFEDLSELKYRLIHAISERANAVKFDHVLLSDSPNDFVGLLVENKILTNFRGL